MTWVMSTMHHNQENEDAHPMLTTQQVLQLVHTKEGWIDAEAKVIKVFIIIKQQIIINFPLNFWKFQEVQKLEISPHFLVLKSTWKAWPINLECTLCQNILFCPKIQFNLYSVGVFWLKMIKITLFRVLWQKRSFGISVYSGNNFVDCLWEIFWWFKN